MKKIWVMTVALLFLSTVFAVNLVGCGRVEKYGEDESGKLKVIATIFPAYDWAMNIVGDDNESLEVSLLIDRGIDLHSYQPTVDDILRISTCDLLIYVGGESDSWVQDALNEASNEDIQAINLMEVLGDGLRTEEVVEGMQENRHGDEDEDEMDEHVWLSVKNAAFFSGVIAEAISRLDPANSGTYEANHLQYVRRLEALHDEYRTVVSEASSHTLLFGDRFPFRYLTDDYGLDYYAAFPGCSAETEASFETIAFLANKMDELGLGAVLKIEGSDGKIANIIVQSTKEKSQKILTLDSMQSVSAKDMAAGATYISIMEKNLEVLKEALD